MEQNFLNKVITVVVLLVCISVKAQQTSVVSGNGKFVTHIGISGKDKTSGQNIFDVDNFSVAYQSKISAFQLKTEDSVDSLSLSYSGKLLYVGGKKFKQIFNIRTGKLLFKTTAEASFALANNDNFFVVALPNLVRAMDAYTGEELVDYEVSANNKITRLVVSADDEHIAGVSDRKQIYFWQTGRAKARKKFFGNDFVIATDGKSFTIARETGTQLSIFTYELPTFKRLERLSVDKALREFAREQTMEVRASDPKRKTFIQQPSKYIPGESILSQVGDFVALLAESPNEEKELFVVNTLNGKILNQQIVGTMRQQVALNWYNDSLLIPQNTMQSKVFNAKQAKFESKLDYDFLFSRENNLPNERKQVSTRLLSPDFKLVVVPTTTGGFAIKDALKNKSYTVNGHEFLGFSDNNKNGFVFNSAKKAYGYFNLQAFSKTGVPRITYFSNEVKPITEITNTTDSKAPADYDFVRVKGFKHIKDAKLEDSVQVVLKTVEAGKRSGVQLQLVDKNGYHYIGAGSDYFKKIWCNLMVKNSDGKVRQIEDFRVSEYQQVDTLPNAISLVLDFSGSMGWPRADALQDGVEQFINAKKDQDELAIIKYDHKVVKEIDLSTKKDRLVRRLFKTDFSEFGGSTALLDAINSGIYTVKKARNVGKKIVVVMTDGLENASMATKNEVLANALENGVQIFTIGFGDQVNQGYLKSIAYNTRGGHYQLFDTKSFDWIFNDIYNKALNYYTVNYDTEDLGSQVYMLKVCIDGQTSDSLVVEFENKPADLKLLLETDEDFTDNPVRYDRPGQINLNGFDKPNYSNFSLISVEQPQFPKKVRIAKDEKTQIEDEFETIELPKFNFYYDEIKTVQETDRQIVELANFLKKYPSLKLRIIGHTDNSGTVEYNETLSLDRANKVKKLIVDKGVNPKRLIAEGYGETSPITNNNTEEGKAKNRRVEFRILTE